MAGTGVGKFSSTASNNTSNLTVNFAENMAPSNVNNAARELMGHMRDMYEQLGDGYFEFGDGDGEYTVTRGDADTITITGTGDITSVYYVGRKIRITDGGGNVVEGVISASSHSSTTQTIDLTGISLASGAPTKVELGIDTAAFGGKVILDDDGDTYIEAPTDDTIDIYVAGAKDFSFTANTFTAHSGSNVDLDGDLDVDGTTNLDVVDIDGAVDMASTLTVTGAAILNGGIDINGNLNIDVDGSTITLADGGVNFGQFYNNSSGTFNIVNPTQDKDILFRGDNGGTGIVALTLDMSNDGAAAFNAGATFADGVTITTDDNSYTLTLKSTDADANQGPLLSLHRDSGSPADDDSIGGIQFRFEDDAGNVTTGHNRFAVLVDASNGSEDCRLTEQLMIGGSAIETVRYTSAGTIFNEQSNDLDFRVESNDYTHAFHVNAGNNSVSTGAIERAFGLFTVTSGDSNCGNADSEGDEFVIEVQNSINGGMSILTDQARTGNIFFGDQGANKVGIISYDHSENSMKFGTGGTILHRFTSGGVFSANESAPDAGIHGITLNQGANDGFILTMKSSDVAHGMTDLGETDTYAYFKKSVATEGGLELNMATEGVKAGQIQGFATSIDNNKATDSEANITARARLKSGTAWGNLGSNGNLFSIANHNTTRFIFDSEGDFHADSSSTTFDAYDDAQLVRAYDLSHGRGVINSKFDEYVKYQHEDLAKAGLVGREQDGSPNHYINVTGFQRLHNGAIWQQYEKTERLANAMYELAKAAVGEDKANEILKQNEIKLLN